MPAAKFEVGEFQLSPVETTANTQTLVQPALQPEKELYRLKNMKSTKQFGMLTEVIESESGESRG